MRDLEQVRLAIEAVRALLPLLEQEDAEQMRPVRDALAQLQLAYARELGGRRPAPRRPRASRRARQLRSAPAAQGPAARRAPAASGCRPGTQT